MSKNTDALNGKWFCQYCDEWHLNSESCSVHDVREVREERINRMVDGNYD